MERFEALCFEPFLLIHLWCRLVREMVCFTDNVFVSGSLVREKVGFTDNRSVSCPLVREKGSFTDKWAIFYTGIYVIFMKNHLNSIMEILFRLLCDPDFLK